MSQPLRRLSRAAAVVRLAATTLVIVFAATCVRSRHRRFGERCRNGRHDAR
jgi:hypothetical protein